MELYHNMYGLTLYSRGDPVTLMSDLEVLSLKTVILLEVIL